MISKLELEEVKKQIRNEPNRMYMQSWTDDIGCNTTHCIGGWLQSLYPDKYSFVDEFDTEHRPLTYNNMPDSILEVDADYDSDLFQVGKWLRFISEELREDIKDSILYYNDIDIHNEEEEDVDWIFDNEYYDEIDDKERVELVCRVIDEYIKKYDVK